jgi:hypothetical protein
MRYRILATDYDGTLAHDGIVDVATVDVLQRCRDAGLRLVLVTGRELSDLFNTFSHVHHFELVVAENGAVIYAPRDGSVESLAEAPPPAFVQRLQDADIPLSVGHSIVATVIPHEHVVLNAIRDLGLEWHVIFNKEAVMALPANVTKATGLAAALAHLDVPATAVVGIGDAENDHAFLRCCGLAVAVQNAVPSLKESADLVTEHPRGAGVRELVERLLDGAFNEVGPDPQKHERRR